MTERHRVSTRSIGVHAVRTTLVSCTDQSSIVAVFGSVFYIRTSVGLICVTLETVDDGPISLRTDSSRDWRDLGMQVGQPAELTSFHIRVPGLLFVDLSAARIWEPELIACPVAVETISAGLNSLRRRLAGQVGTAGLSGFLMPEFMPDSTHVMCRRVAPLICRTRAWMARAMQSDVRAPGDWAMLLLGAGPGLTPSGDDFLAGALIGLHATGHAAAAAALWRQIETHLQTRTNEISAALLAAASEGHGGAALHRAIAALFNNSNTAGLDRALADIAQIGHSSGWDALLGIVTVFDALATVQESHAA